ncbi:nucleotidyltransferase domain-containing protein [Candidatus Woesearchaeota archaeon]|nr:nucleotidyltransferase domain-containing protein [Candidatus Woesearchaeota archaeon]
MFQKNKLKIMGFFFEEPGRDFHLRELSRLSGIAPTSLRNYLAEFQKKGLIIRNNTGIYPSFRANYESPLLKFYKQQAMFFKIEESGLIGYLEEKTNSTCIVLFGSIRKGEYDKKSDIDLFVQAKDSSLVLNKFEKMLDHKIHIIFEDDISKLTKGLLNNIINGICLSGYLKVLD